MSKKSSTFAAEIEKWQILNCLYIVLCHFVHFASLARYIGVLAHLVERNVRNVKVRGSSPLYSTNFKRKRVL